MAAILPAERPSGRNAAALLGAAILATALSLAACGSDGALPPGAARSDNSSMSVTVPLPVTVPIPPPPAEPATAMAAPVTPESLVGQTADAVNARLGQPSFARRDGPSTIWQYRGTGCVLDLFLYRADPSAAPVVDHAELRPLPANGPRPDPACLDALLARTS